MKGREGRGSVPNPLSAVNHREAENPSTARMIRGRAVAKKHPAAAQPKKRKRPEAPEMIDESKRNFLLTGSAAAALIGVGAMRLMTAGGEAPPDEEGHTIESRETVHRGGFERHVESYQVLYRTLTRNEVVFLKEDGSPYPPIRIERVADDPGMQDVDPVNTDGSLNQSWLDYQRRKLVAKHGGTYEPGESPTQMNVRGVIDNFVKHHLTDETVDIDTLTFMDVVKYFAKEKPQELGIGGESPLRFLRTHVLDRQKALQTPAMQELREKNPDRRDMVINEETERLWSHFPRLIPALAAQESQYNNGAASDADANGILQFTKPTWADLGYPPEHRPLPLQVEGLDRHMRIAYSYIHSPAREHFRSYFETESDFIDNFLLPVLINTYNSGHDRLVDVMNWFAEHYLSAGKPLHGQRFEGKELYHRMAHAAAAAAPHLDEETKKKYDKLSGYRKDSNEYVERIFALIPLVEAIA